MNNKCLKPNCDCLEKAEQANGGNPVKSYPCLAEVWKDEPELNKYAMPALTHPTPAAPESEDDLWSLLYERIGVTENDYTETAKQHFTISRKGESGNEAAEFVNFIHKYNWQSSTNSDGEIFWQSASIEYGNMEYHTTAQLYTIFKQQKNQG